MKKIIAVFWCASLLFLTACQKPAGMPTDNEFHAETDCQYSLAGSMEGMQFAESDNGYYTLFGFFLMFIDGETMTVTPLCSKPNCLHEKETDIDRRMECEAYLPYATGLYYQNHTLYVLTSGLEMGQFITELTSMNPDGSSRKTLLHFDSGNISHAFIHRGWLYYAGTVYSEEARAKASICALPLNQPEAKPTVLFTSEKNFSHNVFTGMNAYDSYLYFSEYQTEDTNTVYILNWQTGGVDPSGRSARREHIGQPHPDRRRKASFELRGIPV